ncbi:glycosyltransferase [Kineosporia sp. J2-2]|uniref:Glycosyltransferase n=1 Tax=Kineosporia corallincola TaxID=2835133 RepID=A0ABS5TPC7_9ACTN|nr:glycosyltransferase [Kineosporia corallincola]MBT0772046.1 glycosyltransferase [Kineosporia corallincola]
MRTLIVSPLPPRRDGIGDYSAKLVRAYRDHGDEVGALTLAPTTESLAHVGLVSFSPRRWLRTLRGALAWKPDVVHVQHAIATYGPHLALIWPLVAVLRLRGVRVVITHHEVTRDVERLGPPGRVYYALVSRLAHRLHVHTDAAAQGLPAGLRPRVLVRPHPVYPLPTATTTADRLRARHGLHGRRVALLFGYVNAEKGIAEAIEAFAVLVGQETGQPGDAAPAALVVAGEVRPRPSGFTRFEAADRAYLASLHALVDEHDLHGRVIFTGRVPDGEIAAWLELADVLLLPYTRTEQSGVANLAIAAGTPVLATRTGGLEDLFGDRLPMIGSLAPAGFAGDLAAALADPAGLRARAVAAYADLAGSGSAADLVAALRPEAGSPAAAGATAAGPAPADPVAAESSPSATTSAAHDTTAEVHP